MKVLSVEVWDNGMFKDDLVGKNPNVSLDPLLQRQGGPRQGDLWVDFFHKDNKPAGRIHLAMSFTPDAPAPRAPPPQPRAAPPMMMPQQPVSTIPHDYEALKAENARLRNAIADQGMKYEQLNAENERLRSQLMNRPDNSAQLTQLRNERDKAMSDYNNSSRDLGALRNQVNQLTKELDDLRSIMPVPAPPSREQPYRDVQGVHVVTLEEQGYRAPHPDAFGRPPMRGPMLHPPMRGPMHHPPLSRGPPMLPHSPGPALHGSLVPRRPAAGLVSGPLGSGGISPRFDDPLASRRFDEPTRRFDEPTRRFDEPTRRFDDPSRRTVAGDLSLDSSYRTGVNAQGRRIAEGLA